MKSIQIGYHSRGWRNTTTVDYHQATTKLVPRTENTRPQYCIELSGGNCLTHIYAASAGAFERVRHVIASGDPKRLIAAGPDVLGIHFQLAPRGWPFEAQGRISVRRASDAILLTAQALLPSKPAPRYPFPEKPGVEIISLYPQEVIDFLPYHDEDAVTIRKNTVTLAFRKNRNAKKLYIVVADRAQAASLGASFLRHTRRRLMLNNQVMGISLTSVNGTKFNFGNLRFKPAKPKKAFSDQPAKALAASFLRPIPRERIK